MNLFTLSWNYIKNKKLNTILNTVLLAFGIGIIIFLLLIQKQVKDKFEKDVRGIKMVIGAKGSPLQLILCNIYHIDFPTGNIKLEDAEKIMNNRMFVKKSIPLSLGDSYGASRIVGTTHDYPKHYKAKIGKGRFWSKNKALEATIGAKVAKETGLKIGDTFSSSHGLDGEGESHDENKYTVVGIFKPSQTIIDKLIFTNLKSVWAVHDLPTEPETIELEDGTKEVVDNREITALIITDYTNPIAAINLPRFVNNVGNLQAASPALEVARLYSLIGVGDQVLNAFGLIIILIAVLSIFIALYNALKERQYDLAIMRTLGASRAKLFIQIILEGLILASLGALLGFILGHGAVAYVGGLEDVSDKFEISGLVLVLEEIWIIALIFSVGLLSSIIPAIQTYSIDISRTLSR